MNSDAHPKSTSQRLASPQTIKRVMSQYGFRFSKSLGQNFIIDPGVIDRIVDGAEIAPTDAVIEIGPGIGVMTQALCERAKKVVAIEIDSALIPILKETMSGYDNLEIVHADVLKVDMNALIQRAFDADTLPKVVANLPYYVTTPIIMGLLEARVPISEMSVMIQKEVADRIAARPSTKAYGALSVAVQYFTEPTVMTKVPRHVFMPAPTVDSVVLRLKVRDTPPVALLDEAIFFKTVKDAFGKRRKTLLNALTGGHLGLTRDEAGAALESAGIAHQTRGEALSIQEFATLANAVAELR